MSDPPVKPPTPPQKKENVPELLYIVHPLPPCAPIIWRAPDNAEGFTQAETENGAVPK